MRIDLTVDIKITWLHKLGGLAALLGAVLLVNRFAVAEFEPWMQGDPLTSAKLNKNFKDHEDRLVVLEAKTRVSVVNVTGFAVASGARVKVPFANELYDDKNEYDSATSTFTALVGGDYEVCAMSTFNNANVTSAELSLFVDDTLERVFSLPDAYTAFGCRTVRLDAGAEVDVRIRQSSGSTLNVTADPLYHWLTIHQL